jgi:hypothetical protein
VRQTKTDKAQKRLDDAIAELQAAAEDAADVGIDMATVAGKLFGAVSPAEK